MYLAIIKITTMHKCYYYYCYYQKLCYPLSLSYNHLPHVILSDLLMWVTSFHSSPLQPWLFPYARWHTVATARFPIFRDQPGTPTLPPAPLQYSAACWPPSWHFLEYTLLIPCSGKSSCCMYSAGCSLPPELSKAGSFSHFRSQLKSYLFRAVFVESTI